MNVNEQLHTDGCLIDSPLQDLVVASLFDTNESSIGYEGEEITCEELPYDPSESEHSQNNLLPQQMTSDNQNNQKLNMKEIMKR